MKCINSDEKDTHLLPAPRVPIGKPIANTMVYLLDERLKPVPPGVSAELYIGGSGLARGYMNRPELTAGKFVRINSELVYRTGDLARWMPGGVIEFMGRIDEQVKVRGYRIELGEIENHLNQHESVDKTVVLAAGKCGKRQTSGPPISFLPPKIVRSLMLNPASLF